MSGCDKEMASFLIDGRPWDHRRDPTWLHQRVYVIQLQPPRQLWRTMCPLFWGRSRDRNPNPHWWRQQPQHRINNWNQAANGLDNSKAPERKHFVKANSVASNCCVQSYAQLITATFWYEDGNPWASCSALYHFLQKHEHYKVTVQAKYKKKKVKQGLKKREESPPPFFFFWSRYSRATEKLFKGVSSWSTSWGRSL